MRHFFAKAKAKADATRRNVGESGVIAAVSDNAHSINLDTTPIVKLASRSSATVKAIKHGKDTCEVCAWLPPRSSMLHAHHIVPIYCGGDNAPSNLIVLCPNCHAVAHFVCGDNRLQRKYMGPRSGRQLKAWMRAAYKPKRLRKIHTAKLRADAMIVLAEMRA